MDDLENVRMGGALVDFLRSLGYRDADIGQVAESIIAHLRMDAEPESEVTTHETHTGVFSRN